MDNELAWAAGFFDGEGSFNVSGNHKSLRLNASITQTDPRALRRFRRAVDGIGSVIGPYERAGRKPQWMWQVQSFEDVRRVAVILWKFLGPVKRSQFTRAWRKWKTRPVGPGYGWNKGGHQSPEWIAKRTASRRARIA